MIYEQNKTKQKKRKQNLIKLEQIKIKSKDNAVWQ